MSVNKMEELLQRVRLVIFDLDETVVENAIPFKELRERILKRMGVEEKPPHLYEFLKERGEKYLKLLEEEEIRRARHARIVKSLPAVLKYLGKKGIKKAILTRNSRKATMIALGDYALKFDAIITREDGFEPKPSPEAIEYLLQKFKVKSEECVVVGDYDYDIAAGKSAGCITVGIRMDKGDYRIESLEELPGLLEEIMRYSDSKH